MSNLYRFCNDINSSLRSAKEYQVEDDEEQHSEFEKFWISRRSNTGYEWFKPLKECQQTTKLYLDFDAGQQDPVTDEIIDATIRQQIIPNLFFLLQHVVPYKDMDWMTSVGTFAAFVTAQNMKEKWEDAFVVFASRTTDGKVEDWSKGAYKLSIRVYVRGRVLRTDIKKFLEWLDPAAVSADKKESFWDSQPYAPGHQKLNMIGCIKQNDSEKTDLRQLVPCFVVKSGWKRGHATFKNIPFSKVLNYVASHQTEDMPELILDQPPPPPVTPRRERPAARGGGGAAAIDNSSDDDSFEISASPLVTESKDGIPLEWDAFVKHVPSDVSEPEWFGICCAMVNDPRLSKRQAEKLFHAWSKKSSSYNEDDAQSRLNRADRYAEYGWNFANKMFLKYAPEKHLELQSGILRLDPLTSSWLSIAQHMGKFYKGIIGFHVKTGRFCLFNMASGLWQVCTEENDLNSIHAVFWQREVRKTVAPQYQKYMRSEDQKQKQYAKELKKVSSQDIGIFTQKMSEAIMSCTELRMDRDVVFNNIPCKLAFKNGVLDLLTNEFEEHKHSNFLTENGIIEWNFERRCHTDQDVVETLNHLMKLGCQDVEWFDNVMMLFGFGLLGVPEQRFEFYIHRGNGSNGKSFLFELLSELMPCYVKKVEFELFEKSGPDKNRFIWGTEGKRIIYVDEAGSSDNRRVLELNDVKIWSQAPPNGKEVKVLYSQQPGQVKITSKLNFLTNSALNFGAVSESEKFSLERRMVYVAWKHTFYGNHTAEQEAKKKVQALGLYKANVMHSDKILGMGEMFKRRYKHALVFLLQCAAARFWRLHQSAETDAEVQIIKGDPILTAQQQEQYQDTFEKWVEACVEFQPQSQWHSQKSSKVCELWESYKSFSSNRQKGNSADLFKRLKEMALSRFGNVQIYNEKKALDLKSIGGICLLDEAVEEVSEPKPSKKEAFFARGSGAAVPPQAEKPVCTNWLCSKDGLPIDPSSIEQEEDAHSTADEEDADSTDHEEWDVGEPIIRKVQQMRVQDEESDEDADDQQYHEDETDEEDVRSATPDDFNPVPDGMTLLILDEFYLLDQTTNRVLDRKTQEYLGQWNPETKSIFSD